jgi:hypothetical protein
MSAVNTTLLESAVNLIRRKFLKKAYEARSNESVSLGVSFRWVGESDIGELSCFEGESRRLFEVKGHRTFCNFFPAHQSGLNRHQDRIGRPCPPFGVDLRNWIPGLPIQRRVVNKRVVV